MRIRIMSCKRTSVILDGHFDLFCFTCEKACSHVYVLPNTLVKFRANLMNSENRDTGKEA